MRLPADWRDPIREGRLLVISPFAAKQKRITAALAAERNKFVAALAHAVLIVYADPAGLVESVARKVLAWRKPLFTLDSPHNASVCRMGAKPITVSDLGSAIRMS
jgi:predicted Rossmann fold nucleotide-binding protein DprA/Smf involved in DNA uptake